MPFKKQIIFILFSILFAFNIKTAAFSDEEMRGVWVSTVLNLDYPSSPTASSSALKQQADSIIAGCYSMGINNIFLQVRPCSDALYKSQIYPWSKYLTGTQGTPPEDDFDPLAYWIIQAHKKNIKIHAWLNPYRVTKNNDANNSEYNSLAESNPAKQHPEYLVKYTDNQYYFNPGLPEVRELLVEGALEIVNNYDVDGIHLDDYFYPGTGFNDTASFTEYGTEFSSIDDWRRNNTDLLIQELNTRLHEADPNIEFGVSPSGIWANNTTMAEGSATSGSESYTKLYADTRKWAVNGWVDYIAPQIYWNIGYGVADYRILANWWAEQLQNSHTKLYIGMADYRCSDAKPTDVWYGTEEIERQLALNRQIPKISGEIHFRYGLIAGSPLQSCLSGFYSAAQSASEGKHPKPLNILPKNEPAESSFPPLAILYAITALISALFLIRNLYKFLYKKGR